MKMRTNKLKIKRLSPKKIATVRLSVKKKLEKKIIPIKQEAKLFGAESVKPLGAVSAVSRRPLVPPRPPVSRASILGRVYGLIGIISAILGIFGYAIIFGMVSLVLGMLAIRHHSDKLGGLSLIAGIVILLMGLVNFAIGLFALL